MPLSIFKDNKMVKRKIKTQKKSDIITSSEAVKVVESKTVIASEINKEDPKNANKVIDDNLLEEMVSKE